MNRRNFLNLGLSAVAVVPVALSAVDFRKKNPEAWKVEKTEDAIKELYGKSETIEKHVMLKAPDIAENGAVIPLSVKSDLKAKTVSIFQDANTAAATAVFTVPDGGMVDYAFRIKMRGTGTITAVVEDRNGKLYSSSKLVKVTKGGCGG